MTYCVAMLLKEGLVAASDSRTHAGVDHIASYRKMTTWDIPGERAIVLLSSGNLSASQAVVGFLNEGLAEAAETPPTSMLTVSSMAAAARLVGFAIREVDRHDGPALRAQGVDASVVFILGGQIKGSDMRLFQIYSAGNFIEAGPETPFFQIGEVKYGKPIIDRVITTETHLMEAAKCALISIDSTLKSNLSVGLPLDLALIRRNAYEFQLRRRIEEGDPYFTNLRWRWSEGLRGVFNDIPNPNW
ncbi:MAG: peptidase [Proteobacteria bacterium]|nr:peptidase [Pseudomonadota bacterium]